MTTKIICSLILIGAISLVACKKSKEAGPAQPSDESMIITSLVNEAKTNMKAVVPAAAFNDLDWDNAVVVKQKGDGRVAIVKSRKNALDSLVYLSVGTMRMYQWAGEVHAVSPK